MVEAYRQPDIRPAGEDLPLPYRDAWRAARDAYFAKIEAEAGFWRHTPPYAKARPDYTFWLGEEAERV